MIACKWYKILKEYKHCERVRVYVCVCVGARERGQGGNGQRRGWR